MIKVGILGATGYTARQLFKILLRHPHVEMVRATSRNPQQLAISSFHPSLIGHLEIPIQPFELIDFVNSEIACVFSCLPHAASAKFVKPLIEKGMVVIDFSADYRFHDVVEFESLYDEQHPDRERVGSSPYGLPELFRRDIADAPLIANPGCYPTSAILPLAPLLRKELIQAEDIIVDSKSGVSGAGRQLKPHLHFAESNENFFAYNVGAHRHGPEIGHLLSRYSGRPCNVIFTPHLVPMDRGILSTIYVKPAANVSSKEIEAELNQFYETEPFVRVRATLPKTKDVVDTNFCDISVRSNQGRIIIISAIDNLVKGASGAAVQNFNVRFGFDENTALV